MGLTDYLKTMMKSNDTIPPFEHPEVDEFPRGFYKDEEQHGFKPVTDSVDYIWVEGYKGTESDMSCTYRDSYYFSLSGTPSYIEHKQQYELGVPVTVDGEPKMCGNGFHFCLTLKKVFNYYSYNFSNRFFKVQALVKRTDYQKCIDGESDKCVAKTIILTEEIKVEFEHLCNKDDIFQYSGVNVTKEMFEDITVKHLYKTPIEAYKAKFTEQLITQYGYKRTFAEYVVGCASVSHCKDLIKLVDALKSQDAGNDLSIYMILKLVSSPPF